jgi:hypothetical protein
MVAHSREALRALPASLDGRPGHLARAGWAAFLVVTSLLALGASAAEPGAPQSAVYTSHGVRYQAVLGKLDELFPKPGAGSSVAGEARAFAVDVVRPEGDTVRLLVPRTDGDELELEPALIYEEATSTLFALWLARGANERSHVLFAALRENRWSDPISVTRQAMVIERPPSVVLTREATQRTVVHLSWVASEPGGVHRFYSPIVLAAGRFAGWNPIIDLGRLDAHPGGGSASPRGLWLAGGVADGVDLRSVILATANEATGHLLTARSRVLPLSLVSFSDEARNHLIGVGGWRRSPRELADDVGGHLEELEEEVHTGARAYLTRAARAFILKNANVITPNEALADALRRHLLEAGASLLGQEFEAAPETCGLVEVGPDDAEQAEPAAHVLEICRIRDRVLPHIAGEDIAIRASRDGALVLLTWRADGVLWFRLHDGAAWSEARSIEAGADEELLWKSLGR